MALSSKTSTTTTIPTPSLTMTWTINITLSFYLRRKFVGTGYLDILEPSGAAMVSILNISRRRDPGDLGTTHNSIRND